jgi:hypothetical protein
VEDAAGKRAGVVTLTRIAPLRKWRVEFNRKELADGSTMIYWNYRTGSGDKRRYKSGGKVDALPDAHQTRLREWLKKK